MRAIPGIEIVDSDDMTPAAPITDTVGVPKNPSKVSAPLGSKTSALCTVIVRTTLHPACGLPLILEMRKRASHNNEGTEL